MALLPGRTQPSYILGFESWQDVASAEASSVTGLLCKVTLVACASAKPSNQRSLAFCTWMVTALLGPSGWVGTAICCRLQWSSA